MGPTLSSLKWDWHVQHNAAEVLPFNQTICTLIKGFKTVSTTALCSNPIIVWNAKVFVVFMNIGIIL